jgi:hypothetical protein
MEFCPVEQHTEFWCFIFKDRDSANGVPDTLSYLDFVAVFSLAVQDFQILKLGYDGIAIQSTSLKPTLKIFPFNKFNRS